MSIFHWIFWPVHNGEINAHLIFYSYEAWFDLDY
jgi:hypothetical protein